MIPPMRMTVSLSSLYANQVKGGRQGHGGGAASVCVNKVSGAPCDLPCVMARGSVGDLCLLG